MRQLILCLTLSAATVVPAQASLVYLNDIEVLDTNTNLVWLAPWVTEGLGPVNAYTANGWRLPGANPPVTRSVFHVAFNEYDGGNLTFDELLYFFGDFIEGAPIVGSTGRWTSHGVNYGEWPPTRVDDNGRTDCCFFWIEAVLALEPGLDATVDIAGGQISPPASGIWPDSRLFLVRDYSVVPIPPAVLLFGSALGLMGVMRRRRDT